MAIRMEQKKNCICLLNMGTSAQSGIQNPPVLDRGPGGVGGRPYLQVGVGPAVPGRVLPALGVCTPSSGQVDLPADPRR